LLFLPFVIAVVLAVVLWLAAYSAGADLSVLAAIMCVPAAGALAGIGAWAAWPGDRDSVTRGVTLVVLVALFAMSVALSGAFWWLFSGLGGQSPL
jgi:hypothetical protein